MNKLLLDDMVEKMHKLVPKVKSSIIHMTSIAASGHPGGPLGATETILTLVNSLNLDKNNPYNPSKDKIVMSAGHYSAGIYSALASLGLVSNEDIIISNFRTLKDVVEGHVTHKFPFIWDSTGHLGYGPSIAAAHSLSDRILGYDKTRIMCFMGDGEQTKGPIFEALRFIKKYELNNITIVIDVNSKQLSGSTKDIMPMDIEANYKANGFEVVKADGHDLNDLKKAFDYAKNSNNNVVILSNTIMGKGIVECEGTHEYHGKPLKNHKKGIEDIGCDDNLENYKEIRKSDKKTDFLSRPRLVPKVGISERIVYEKQTACRNAFGEALVSIGRKTLNNDGTPKEDYSPIAVFDCDLAGSVGTAQFLKEFSSNFYQAGIQEHSTSIIAGTMSTRGISTWLAMFGVFGHSMGFNEHFLTAVNDGNLKLVTTHNSIDVGEDSKTHSPISYLVLNNHPGWETFCPCDANQTDAVVRYMAKEYGNMHLAVGRSSIDIVTKQGTNEPFFDKNYNFSPDKFDVLRDYGNDAVIITYGTPVNRAIKASEELKKEGVNIKVLNFPTPGKVSDKIAEICSNAKVVLTFEDHNVDSGIGKTIDPILLNYHIITKTIPNYKRISIGMKEYSKSAPSNELYTYFGIDEKNIIKKIKENLN